MAQTPEDLKPQIRKLIMLISDIRAQDTERYNNHINFMNEVALQIKQIADNMNESWQKIHASLDALNDTIKDSLDTLLTGINPEGIRETSFTLKEIMNTMNKSIQSMNLETVVRELRGMMGGGIRISAPAGEGDAEMLEAGMGGYSSPGGGGGEEEQEIYGYVPPGMKGKKKEEKKETHLLRPSDLFGTGLQAEYDDPHDKKE